VTDSANLRAMDRGDPISYLALQEGVPVLSSDGVEVGQVEHVLADAEADVFDGVIIDTRAGPGGWRFADAPQVAEIHERAVTLNVDAAGVERLPEPSENPAVMEAGPEDFEPDDLADKLRRAWDLLSGRY
jgi:hypothetical protein